jgi:hypothetical protein
MLDRAGQAISEHVNRRLRVVDARHLEPESRKPKRKAPLAGSGVEHGWPGARGQEEVE